jgi:hypothetical protein
MFVPLVVVIVATIVAVVRGGSLDNLAGTRFAWTWVLFAGLVIQIVFDLWAPVTVGGGLGLAITLFSIACVLFFLLQNRDLPGTLVASVGLAMNALVIAANGAMPVSLSAMKTAGIGAESFGQLGIKHELMDGATRIRWLGDIFPIPNTEKIFSAGDVVLAVGLGILVYSCTRMPIGERVTTPPSTSG